LSLDLLQLFRNSRPSNLQQPRKWFDLRFTQGTAEILLYDVIGADWFGGVSAKDFVNELNRVRDADRIVLRINSPGGDVGDGIAIRNALIDHPAPVDTRIEGFGLSTASWVGMLGNAGGKANTFKVSANAMLMIHEPWNIWGGDADSFRKQADILDKFGDDIAAMYQQKAGDADWRGLMRAETWYSDAEAVAAGLADEVSGEATAENRGDPAIRNLFLNLFNKTPQQLLVPETAPIEPAKADLLPGYLAYQKNLARMNGVQV
jgi:ATP-dependent protease ClpP protease subunit